MFKKKLWGLPPLGFVTGWRSFLLNISFDQITLSFSHSPTKPKSTQVRITWPPTHYHTTKCSPFQQHPTEMKCYKKCEGFLPSTKSDYRRNVPHLILWPWTSDSNWGLWFRTPTEDSQLVRNSKKCKDPWRRFVVATPTEATEPRSLILWPWTSDWLRTPNSGIRLVRNANVVVGICGGGSPHPPTSPTNPQQTIQPLPRYLDSWVGKTKQLKVQ